MSNKKNWVKDMVKEITKRYDYDTYGWWIFHEQLNND